MSNPSVPARKSPHALLTWIQHGLDGIRRARTAAQTTGRFLAPVLISLKQTQLLDNTHLAEQKCVTLGPCCQSQLQVHARPTTTKLSCSAQTKNGNANGQQKA